MTAFYIVLVVLLFGVLVFVHELGHFITAKLFSLFMGPALIKKQKGETLYALRCIPIGGYCAMEGEDGDSDNPRAFGNAKLWKRLIILVAGSFMNFVAGVLIAVLFVSIRFDVLPGTTFGTFAEGCPYESESAFQVGDTIYVDGLKGKVIAKRDSNGNDDFHAGLPSYSNTSDFYARTGSKSGGGNLESRQRN